MLQLQSNCGYQNQPPSYLILLVCYYHLEPLSYGLQTFLLHQKHHPMCKQSEVSIWPLDWHWSPLVPPQIAPIWMSCLRPHCTTSNRTNLKQVRTQDLCWCLPLPIAPPSIYFCLGTHNTNTETASPQFHCVFNKHFDTCQHDATFTPTWQAKAELSNNNYTNVLATFICPWNCFSRHLSPKIREHHILFTKCLLWHCHPLPL